VKHNCPEEIHRQKVMPLRDSAPPTYATARRFPRHPFDVRIQVAVFRDGATKALWGRTNELAIDGVGATLTGELKAGEVVSLEFPIPIPPLVIKVRAIVRYSDGLRCGFEFLVVSQAQRETMRRVCEVLARTH
jgi:hypothetical protein